MQALGAYAAIQFSPFPEKLEFVNVGAYLRVPEMSYADFRVNSSPARVEKLFGHVSKAHFKVAVEAFCDRLRSDPKLLYNEDAFERFSSLRANNIRFTKSQKVVVEGSPQLKLEELYETLVGTVIKPPRTPKIKSVLRERFLRAGVFDLLDKPAPVELPQGVRIDAPFAFQNGAYNLIDPIRITSNLNESLDNIGRRAIEGAWLHVHSRRSGRPTNLVVVGDFSASGEEFYKAVRNQLASNQVNLHRFDELNPLFEQIRASRH